MNVFDKTRLVSEDVREMSGIVEPNQVVKYRVIRTGSGHLPVYIEKSNNGRVQTIVRKIEVSEATGYQFLRVGGREW